jgi:hypothetical protein
MIRHNDKDIQADGRRMVRDGCPATLGNLAPSAEMYLAIDDVTKETASIVGADRHVVRARRCIVVARQT